MTCVRQRSAEKAVRDVKCQHQEHKRGGGERRKEGNEAGEGGGRVLSAAARLPTKPKFTFGEFGLWGAWLPQTARGRQLRRQPSPPLSPLFLLSLTLASDTTYGVLTISYSTRSSFQLHLSPRLTVTVHELALQESDRDTLVNSSCQEFFNHMRKVGVLLLVRA